MCVCVCVVWCVPGQPMKVNLHMQGQRDHVRAAHPPVSRSSISVMMMVMMTDSLALSLSQEAERLARRSSSGAEVLLVSLRLEDVFRAGGGSSDHPEGSVQVVGSERLRRSRDERPSLHRLPHQDLTPLLRAPLPLHF